jgi:Ca2+-binding EF-hand superfamily protein
MVQREEIDRYFSMTSQLTQTKVVMTFSDDVTSLFRLMDADGSNRLSPRELLTLKQRIAPFDRNQNGKFDPDDFVSQYALTMAFSTPEGLEFTPNQMQSNSQTGGVRKLSRTGPLWYQRMDRNKDGDISWREFLGPRSTFDKLDTDHDGLISKEEAEAADASATPAAKTTAGP